VGAGVEVAGWGRGALGVEEEGARDFGGPAALLGSMPKLRIQSCAYKTSLNCEWS